MEENVTMNATENVEAPKKSIYSLIEEDILARDLDEKTKEKKLKKLEKLKKQQVNIMLVGATGSGKSSTVNALFDMNLAKVGEGADPETTGISQYQFENLTVWDTPGLGDGVERDQEIADDILLKLQEKDEDGKQVIDMAVVVMDASTKDFGSYYTLLNDVLIPEFGDDANKRIIIALNQADIAMKGTHWNEELNEPDEVLSAFLKKKAASVRARIKENTGLDVKPVCYCAGFFENGSQRKPYNLAKLLYFIVKAAPKAKRLNIAANVNADEDNWEFNENYEYTSRLNRDFGEIILSCIDEGIENGVELGEELLGIPGIIIGGIVGAAAGGVRGVFEAVF
ncbi:GTPase family protein [Butyrivibrio sp. VCB2001]|uniref:GTPase family protein n=1 Tax=Butyrivibrio sp. VCB2001 TaxID=1280667 RepID=UPI0004145F31|nr:GTPase [Butyrivibrio sp. VCB2001]